MHECPVMSDSLLPAMNFNPPGYVHGILQTRILEQVTISFSRGSSRPGDQTWVSCIGRQILYCSAPGEAAATVESVFLFFLDKFP